jgi:hypothetical protein
LWGLFFERRASPAGKSDPIGGAILERGRQFVPSPADGIDVQAREPGDEPIPTVPELGTLDGGVPASLLLIEPTEQEIHLPVDLLVGMMIQAEAVGALALMDFLLGHGLTLRDRLLDSMTSLPKSVEIVLGWPPTRQSRNQIG